MNGLSIPLWTGSERGSGPVIDLADVVMKRPAETIGNGHSAIIAMVQGVGHSSS